MPGCFAFDIKQTAEHVVESEKYKHVLIYGHGGLNSPKGYAIRIEVMKPVLKANGIYPRHIMYDTGIQTLEYFIKALGQVKKGEYKIASFGMA
ncbi:MAG: hypothetical protein ACJAUG_002629 [Halioglobus sp.]|jgi:hypothetical protein